MSYHARDSGGNRDAGCEIGEETVIWHFSHIMTDA